MRVEDRVLEVDSTLSGERVGMAVGEDALAHIMAVLTDLYSDPELAIIREYSTNALDSQIDAGVTRPIEVTTPTPLSAFLKIRDFGLGLDAEGIRTVYSQYGVSTKRDSDEVVGMLGLGCKSALTYTDQFMLTGIKDGVQTQVSIGRDEDGGGSMTIVSTTPTDEPNGVLVVIPAKRDNRLAQKATAFFQWWAPGTVLLNGEQPKAIRPSLTHIVGETYTAPRGSVSEDTVVMGNVAYPIPQSYFDNKEARRCDWFGTPIRYDHQGESLIAFVPIGAVNFAPSREALRETKRTRETLTAVIAEARATLKDSLFAQVAAAPTASEAQELTRRIVSLGIRDKPTWNGKPVMLQLERVGQAGVYDYRDDTSLFLKVYVNPNYGRRKAGERTPNVTLGSADKIIWIKNFDGKDMTPTRRAKLDLWLSNQRKIKPEDYKLFIATAGFTEDEAFWIKGDPMIDFAKVDELKLPKALNSDGTTRPKGSYKAYFGGEARYRPISADQIDVTKPVIYYNGNNYSFGNTPEVRAGFVGTSDRWGGVQTVNPDITIVLLPANRIDKFKRDFPTAVELRAYATAEVAKYLAQQTKEDLKAAHFQRGGESRRLRELDTARIDDPALVAAVKLAQADVSGINAHFDRWARWIPMSTTDCFKNPLEGYPLVDNSLDGRSTQEFLDHTYMYINAVYAAKEDA